MAQRGPKIRILLMIMAYLGPKIRKSGINMARIISQVLNSENLG
jgi:hypothetical protein